MMISPQGIPPKLPKSRPDGPVRLLALDVDGTVLDPAHELDPIVRAAIHNAIDAGIRVVLCTGRRFRRAKAIAELIGLTDPMVCNSGALIKCPSSHATLWRADHSPDDARHLVGVFQTHQCPVLSFLDTPNDEPDFVTPAFPSGCAFFDEYLEHNRNHRKIDPDWLTRANDFSGHFHLCAAGSKEKMQRIADALEAQRPGHYQIFVQKSPAYLAWMCEVLRRDASKWTALKQLSAAWGIADHEICAVGDDVNDVPMIENAGWGVAMGHATEFVKSRAQWIGPCNAEHGVAEVVRILLESQS